MLTIPKNSVWNFPHVLSRGHGDSARHVQGHYVDDKGTWAIVPGSLSRRCALLASGYAV